ncbi:conjugal transfer protein TrbJ [Ralstonia pseudosolanacearum]|uniref:conjugal transfer protein TrbJ n=1 Tax=Ralstonia pseudosolanacearum TaxID=1310165 RepID=UPI00156F2548|nr:conjugal transfer protein TrbJ [Ralstonia solanacearum]QKL96208.1 conjugal transfer protein TrbJ [Ralstonia solanacearum]QLR09322.1 conjugal transfer protein TrbJ [Ralstonia solanacearum]
MKFKTRIAGFITAALFASQASAGSVAGTGGSTEVTQIINMMQLIQSYEQQVQAYVRQGVQVEAELRNLISNPTSILGSDVGNMINTIGQIWSGGQSIGYNLAQIDQNFARTFKSPTAGNLAKMFTSWHQTNTDTLQAALRSIGAQRDQYASSQAALTDLYNRSQSTNGNLDALQTLSQINVRQIQELQSLKELMATQASAATTYLATQNAKDQKGLDDATGLMQAYKTPIPSVQSAPAPKWKSFLPN